MQPFPPPLPPRLPARQARGQVQAGLPARSWADRRWLASLLLLAALAPASAAEWKVDPQWKELGSGTINEGSWSLRGGYLSSREWDFNSSAQIQVGSSSMSSWKTYQDPNTGEYILHSQRDKPAVERRILIDLPGGFTRILDRIAAHDAIRVRYAHTRSYGIDLLGSQGLEQTQRLSNSGTLPEGSVGIWTTNQQGARQMGLCSAHGPRPEVSYSNNELAITYQLPASDQDSAIMQIIYHPDAPRVGELLLRHGGISAIEDLRIPPALRHRLRSHPVVLPTPRTSASTDLAEVRRLALQTLQIQPSAAAERDALLFASGEKLSGRLQASELQLQRGETVIQIAAADVLALRIEADGALRCFDRQGQVWRGRSVSPTTTWHFEVDGLGRRELPLHRLPPGTAVVRHLAADAASGLKSSGSVETRSGERFLCQALLTPQPLQLHSPWGGIQAAADALLSVQLVPEPFPHWRYLLRTHGLITCLPAEEAILQVQTETQTLAIPANEIVSLTHHAAMQIFIPLLGATAAPQLDRALPAFNFQGSLQALIAAYAEGAAVPLRLAASATLIAPLGCDLNLPAGSLSEQLYALQSRLGCWLSLDAEGLAVQDPRFLPPPAEVQLDEILLGADSGLRLQGELQLPLPAVAIDPLDGSQHTITAGSLRRDKAGLWHLHHEHYQMPVHWQAEVVEMHCGSDRLHILLRDVLSIRLAEDPALGEAASDEATPAKSELPKEPDTEQDSRMSDSKSDSGEVLESHPAEEPGLEEAP